MLQSTPVPATEAVWARGHAARGSTADADAEQSWQSPPPAETCVRCLHRSWCRERALSQRRQLPISWERAPWSGTSWAPRRM